MEQRMMMEILLRLDLGNAEFRSDAMIYDAAPWCQFRDSKVN